MMRLPDVTIIDSTNVHDSITVRDVREFQEVWVVSVENGEEVGIMLTPDDADHLGRVLIDYAEEVRRHGA